MIIKRLFLFVFVLLVMIFLSSQTARSASCPSGNGLYCGSSGKGQNPDYLYNCSNGNYSIKTKCSNGCKKNSAGKNDECQSSSKKCPSGNGYYCGDKDLDQNENTLYKCSNGNYDKVEKCSNGCKKNAAGTNDTCKAATAPTPTPSPTPTVKCPSGNGLYCGDSGKSQNTNYLYQCTNGSYSLKESCSNGCQRNAAGTNDSCKAVTPTPAPTPTVKCPSGNGLYCGDSGKSQNTNYLYQCTNGSYSLKESCSNGCQRNAAGTNDSCKAVTPTPAPTPTVKCPSGNGLYCGDSGKSQNTNYLYQCTNGSYSLKESCSNGCQRNAAGTNDSCKAVTPTPAPTPTVKCPSGNGLYCGDSGKSQNTNYLYQCTNGSYSLKESCSNGCQRNAAGTNDSCKAVTPTPAPTPTVKCPSGNGLYCGDSGKSQNTNYLYQCTNGSYSLKESCSNGCQKNTAGMNDSCKIGSTTGVSLAKSWAPTKVSCPVVGSSWTNARGSSLHAPGKGIGGADDSYAFDLNQSGDADAGKPVYAVADGEIYTGNGWGGKSYGQILINHTESNGGEWSTGYLHLVNIMQTTGKVHKGQIIGYIGNKSPTPNLPNHLHFAVYKGHNGITSVPVNLSCLSSVSGTESGFEGRVLGASTEKDKPVVKSFSLNKSSVSANETVTISYTVSDNSGLKQVELWRSTNNNNWAELSNKRQYLSGKTQASGIFTDSPSSAGTYYYGIHVVDNAGNWDSEGGAKKLTVGGSSTDPGSGSGDTTKPTLISFSVDRSKINEGETVRISYNVKDSGGSGLRQVELWRGKSKDNLGNYKTDRVSGNGPLTGQFKDDPSPAGTYYYGIHVLDNKDNLAYDNGALPVIVIRGSRSYSDKVKPVVNSFSLDKSSISVHDTITISYTVSDNSGLRQVELWRSTNNNDWAELTNKRQYLSGKTQASGYFTCNPSSAGTYYYGIHVVDTAGNWDSEGGPKKLTVVSTPGNAKPVVNSFSLNKSSMNVNDTVTISYTVRDSSGLKQVELWRSTNNNNWAEITNKRQYLSGRTQKSGYFTDSPSIAGTYYYGIHVVDTAGNWDSEGGAKKIIVIDKTKQDNEKPQIISFEPVSPRIKLGETVEIKYGVRDSGGSGLKQVELWRGYDKGNLTHYKNITDKVSGNTAQGRLKDTPDAVGTYYYGIHVLDNANNLTYDDGAKPVVVGDSTSIGSLSDNNGEEKTGPINFKEPERKECQNNKGFCYPQCTDFVKYNVPINHKGDAWTYWNNKAGWNQYPNGSSTKPPKAGDILVWKNTANGGIGGKYGHVALVNMVDVSKQLLIRTDSNFNSDFHCDCHVRNTKMSIKKNGNYYTIGGANSRGLYGWLSKD